MRRLAWPEEHGGVTWSQAHGRWVGSWERRRARDGVFATAREAMVSFVLEGSMTVDVGGRSEELRPGDALLIRGGAPFRYHMAQATRLLVTEVRSAAQSSEIARVRAEELPRAAARALAQARDDSPNAIVRVADAADGLFQRAGSAIPGPAEQSSALMLRIKAYLDGHFREPDQRRQHVAKRFGVDAFYLSRHFARTLGMTPKAYLQWLRFEHFLRSLLAEPAPRSFIDLALDAGFSDYATFSRRVRERFGVPPSALLAPHGPAEPKINFAHAHAGAGDHHAGHEALVVPPRVPFGDPGLLG
jgi:AraC-like DNA-binding protein